MRDNDNLKSGKAVSDPYGGDDSDFEDCYQILHESCVNLLEELIQKHNL